MNSTQLSAPIFEFLNGKNLNEKRREAMMLLTVTEDGWPHTAMISVGEMVGVNQEELRIGLWQNTETSKNIVRTKKATVNFFYNGKAIYIELSLEKLDPLKNTEYPRDRFSAKIISFREDMAKYADIISGVQIELKMPEEVIRRWEQTVEDLLK